MYCTMYVYMNTNIFMPKLYVCKISGKKLFPEVKIVYLNNMYSVH